MSPCGRLCITQQIAELSDDVCRRVARNFVRRTQPVVSCIPARMNSRERGLRENTRQHSVYSRVYNEGTHLSQGENVGLGERRWFVLERPRRDINGGSETEVTVTSKLQAKETEKRREGRILWGRCQRLERRERRWV